MKRRRFEASTRDRSDRGTWDDRGRTWHCKLHLKVAGRSWSCEEDRLLGDTAILLMALLCARAGFCSFLLRWCNQCFSVQWYFPIRLRIAWLADWNECKVVRGERDLVFRNCFWPSGKELLSAWIGACATKRTSRRILDFKMWLKHSSMPKSLNDIKCCYIFHHETKIAVTTKISIATRILETQILTTQSKMMTTTHAVWLHWSWSSSFVTATTFFWATTFWTFPLLYLAICCCHSFLLHPRDMVADGSCALL